MKSCLKIFGCFCLVAVSSIVLAGEEYSIDRTHSNVGFSVKYMVVTTIRGQFNDFEGSVYYDEDDITKFSAEGIIKATSIYTDNERRDNDLRGERFFEVEKFPEIRFKTKRIEKRDSGPVAIGDFTMKGVTKEVEIPFEVSGPIQDRRGSRIGIEATLVIDRRDYNVLTNRVLDGGGLWISDVVKIELNISAVHRTPRENQGN